MPRATEHIEQIVALIETLLDAWPRVSHGRRFDLLPHLVVAGVRPAGTAGSGAAARRRARRGRRIRQGRRARLRALEGTEARRAVVGHGDRAGPAGLAHRMLRDEHGGARAVVRHPHRRRRSHLPASRGRDRPERGGDRQAVRADMAALPASADGRPEDGQVDRQRRARGRPAGARASRPGRFATPFSPCTTARRSQFSDESLAAAAAAIERLDALYLALHSYREDRADDPSLPGAARRGPGRVRSRPRRRSQRVGGAWRSVRPRARREPPDRRAIALLG